MQHREPILPPVTLLAPRTVCPLSKKIDRHFSQYLPLAYQLILAVRTAQSATKLIPPRVKFQLTAHIACSTFAVFSSAKVLVDKVKVLLKRF